MLTCFNVKKTHYLKKKLHYCRSSMPSLSSNALFSPQARIRNVTPLTRIVSFSFQVSFKISSSPKGEQSRVTDTVMKLVCICRTQAAIKTISDELYTPL